MNQPEQGPPENAGRELRRMMLQMPAEMSTLEPTPEFPQAFGVLMDWPTDEVTVTIVAMSDGTTSLYTTSAFGILGGIGQPPIREAGAQFLQLAQAAFAEASVTQDFGYPCRGNVRFWFLGYGEVRVRDGRQADLEQGDDQLAKLWASGQLVITRFREFMERNENA